MVPPAARPPDPAGTAIWLRTGHGVNTRAAVAVVVVALLKVRAVPLPIAVTNVPVATPPPVTPIPTASWEVSVRAVTAVDVAVVPVWVTVGADGSIRANPNTEAVAVVLLVTIRDLMLAPLAPPV